ncbi:Transcription factor CBF/NF-Y/archaeal histone domain - like 10 [Theobroma cacao]|nr:Transcription factor CBF/NF-Y/archaeal histone domain - like 10 [Theobroma cacao]WRX35350.1 Transcription factor CBF/NF-Y/archaeal histone domain - like 10 [Theobroma cacao]
MRKKLDTRFPAARIKKIMQADEDVGKIAMAVPVLVSKALELFLQDLCDRTYEITLMRGARTMNSLHLKQCVRAFNDFDFLGEIVGKVPDLGGSDAAGNDHSGAKRRKVVDDDDNASGDESKRRRIHETSHFTSCGRGRGRGRGRRRGRGSKTAERETATHCEKFEDDPDISHCQERHTLSIQRLDDREEPDELKNHNSVGKNVEAPAGSFDLNVDLNENRDSTISVAPASPITDSIPEKQEEYPGYSFSEIEKMAIDPIELANLNRGIDEEDYDEEG